MSDVTQVNIVDELNEAYLEYSMSVIVSRALPDVRDGLKPVHRRVLYAMHELNSRHDQPFKKSARIVGDVLGKYHPHGDTPVYGTIVRMAQDFSLRYTLIQGQGNFGSIDGDAPASMRYTEVRMSKLADRVLKDIEKETVGFVSNYDGTLQEPMLLPTMVPNLLVNGSNGIAVGMATNIPSHNMTEVLSALLRLIDHPDASLSDLMTDIPGPDFPTAGIIYGTKGIVDAYRTGRGVIQIRSRVETEDLKNNRQAVVITEIPYQVNKSSLIQKMADLVREKTIEGISDIRDESSSEGIRIVVELRKGENVQLILNQLFKHTPMQVSFGIQMLALEGGTPKLFGLKEMLHSFLMFRKEVITRRSIFDLKKLRQRIHILEGLIKAVSKIDDVIALIKKSKNSQEARKKLIEAFSFSVLQAKSILEMRLHRLTQLEVNQLKLEYEKCEKEATFLQRLLADERLVFNEIKSEITQIKDAFGDERKTVIEPNVSDLTEEDLVTNEDMVITLSHKGYIKRNPLSEYRLQRRGGRGIRGLGVQSDDFVQDLFVSGNRNVLLCFSDRGRVYWLKVFRVPVGGRTARGRPVINLLDIRHHEKVVSVVPISSFETERFVVLVTRKGVIKKCRLKDFQNPRSGGIISMKCDEDDELINAMLTSGSDDILLVSGKGQSIRFSEEQIRCMGRSARGVTGMKLARGDWVVAMAIAEEGKGLLTVSENGFGKRTEICQFRKQNRGGAGVIAMKTTPKVGKVIGSIQVGRDDELMLVTNMGQMIRLGAKGISEVSRNTQGVKLIGLKQPKEQLVSVALCVDSEDQDEGQS